MSKMIKANGPKGVTRPFNPTPGDMDSTVRIVDALEHIAVVLSSIDHNIECIALHLKKR